VSKHEKGLFMLRSAIIFFVLGLFVFLLGFFEVGGVTPQISKLILITFLIFSLLSFIGAITTSESKDRIEL
jgi:uncharacterized membrane protein YtjA (UPF0391 family)